MNQSQLDAQLEADITALLDQGEADGTLGFHKKLKKLFKKVVKVVKKVAPVAAAGAALFYAAPYAVTAVKAISSKIGGVSGAKKGLAAAVAIRGITKPPPAPNIASPDVMTLATQIANQQLAAQGINMRSPQAQAAVNRYVGGTVQNMQAQVTPTTAPFDIKKYLIPAAAAGAALLVLKG